MGKLNKLNSSKKLSPVTSPIEESGASSAAKTSSNHKNSPNKPGLSEKNKHFLLSRNSFFKEEMEKLDSKNTDTKSSAGFEYIDDLDEEDEPEENIYVDNFSTSFDDSSDDDEEANEQRIIDYNIVTQWHAFNKNNEYRLFMNQMVFIAHAAGSYVYRHPQVNKVFQNIRNDKLSNKDIVNPFLEARDIAQKKLKAAITRTCRNVFKTNIHTPLQKILEPTLKNNDKIETAVESAIERLLHYPRLVLRRRNSNSPSPHEQRQLNSIFSALTEELASILEDLSEYNVQSTKVIEEMVDDEKINDFIWQKAKSEAIIFLNSQKLIDKNNIIKANKDTEQLIKQIEPHKYNIFKSKLVKLIKNTKKGESLDTFFADNKEELFKIYFQKIKNGLSDVLVWHDDGNHINTEDLTNSVLDDLKTNHPDWIEPYLPAKLSDLEQQLSTNIKNMPIYFLDELGFIRKEFKKHFKRPTLPIQHTSPIANAVDILAWERIANRSQTRTIEQNKIDSTSKLLRKLNNQRAWHYMITDHYVTEKQEISVGLKRTDKLDFFTNYKQLYADMEKILMSLDTSSKKIPKTIARAIRFILKGEKDSLDKLLSNNMKGKDTSELKTFLTDCSLLIFGTEVTRSPASLVIIQMILELIIKSILSWEEIFTGKDKDSRGGGMLPMSMGGAVPSSRYIHHEHNEYMPFPHKYEGDTVNADVNELKEREAEILKLWIKHCSGLAIKIDDDKPVALTDAQMKELFDLIKTKIESQWFEFKNSPTIVSDETPTQLAITPPTAGGKIGKQESSTPITPLKPNKSPSVAAPLTKEFRKITSTRKDNIVLNDIDLDLDIGKLRLGGGSDSE